MKKFVIVLCIMFLFTSTVSAGISKKVDDFNGIIDIRSDTSIDRSDYLLLKRFSNNEEIIVLKIFREEDDWWFFADVPFEFKIDGEIIRTGNAITDSDMINSNYRNLHTSAYVILDKDLINKISNAKTIILRYHFSNQQPTTLTISDKTLSEWKELINVTKEWEKKKK